MSFETPLWLQAASGTAVTYTAAQYRSVLDALVAVDGVTKKNDCKVSQRAAGANMTVDVAVGQIAVTGSSIANQGTYFARNLATVNVGTFTAPVSGSKIDLVVAQVYDDQSDGSGLKACTAIIVPGSVGGGVPATPPNALPLAQVAISSTTTSITNALITDARTLNTLGDVPLWEVSGGNGQAIASGGSGVPYTGWTVSDNIGMASVTTGGGAVAQQGGRYIVTLGSRIDFGGSGGTKQCYVQQTRGGTVIRAANSPATANLGADPVSVATTFRLLPGDVVKAYLYQNSGSTLHIDDSHLETAFTGCWIGP